MTTKRDPSTFPNDALLTVAEMAKYLRVSRDQAYELVRTSEIPNLKLGKQFRIPFWSLKVWAAQQAGVPAPPAGAPDKSMHH